MNPRTKDLRIRESGIPLPTHSEKLVTHNPPTLSNQMDFKLGGSGMPPSRWLRDQLGIFTEWARRHSYEMPVPGQYPMATSRNPIRFSGFTLIELVISTAIMSIVLSSAYLCLRTGIAGQRLIESRVDVAQNARVAMQLLAADLRSACPLSREFEFLGMDRMIGDLEADNLDFATHNYSPRRVGEADYCEVSYYLDKDPETGTLSLWRRRDPSPDIEPLAGGIREEIAQGLRGLRFEYTEGLFWYDEWGDPLADQRERDQDALLLSSNMYGMPDAVRITMRFDPNTPSDSARSTETDEDTGEESQEPPMVFRTIVYLNLAMKYWLTPTTTSTGTDSGDAGSEAGQGQEQGGGD